jgi:peptide/nickel transport system substrate-binding protein
MSGEAALEFEEVVMKRSVLLAAGAMVIFVLAGATAEIDPNKEVVPGVKRGDCIIIEDPTPGAAVSNPDSFNRWSCWAGGGGGWSYGIQQLALDTLWYIDPDAGIARPGVKDSVWHNSLAAEKPIYNKDYTQMTAKLRKGILWSDGVEFTSADVKYTVELLAQNPTMIFGSSFKVSVKSVETPDKYTVVFNLNQPNSRFHRNFTVRWQGCFIMPKHVWEKAVKDPAKDAVTYNFNPPVSLGAYVIKDYDKQGKWYLWERRADWNKTSIADFGMPAPKYAMYLLDLPNDKKVMMQLNHDLDMVHEVTPEGMVQLAKGKSNANWFQGFPFGHPDPTLISILLNNARAPFDKADVRWALALATDIVKAAMGSYNGAVQISPILYPPTGTSRKYYFDPLQPFLKDFTLDAGKAGKIKPYDTTIAQKIADAARPQFGDQVPKDAERIKGMIGLGWWKYDTKAAAALLEKAGLTQKGGKWYKANGEQFKIVLQNQGPDRPILQRLTTTIAEQWTNFGIETTAIYSQDDGTNRNLGNFDGYVFWNIETWGGHPDMSYFIEALSSDFYTPVGEVHNGSNPIRYKSAEQDRIIKDMLKTDFDSQKNIDLGIEWLKLMVKDMPEIPLFAYNVFVSQDNTYWTGYPTYDKPYANPVTNWTNGRYIFTQLKQALPPKK